MVPDLPVPRPALIDRISPSAANDLLACKLRVGFGRDPTYHAWRRPTPATVLGKASHHVLEQAFRSGSIPPGDRKEALRSEWEQAIAEGVEELESAWAPAVPPPPDLWPGYQLTRTRVLRRALRIAESRADRSDARDAATGDGGLEVSLEAPELRLLGRVDRIDRAAGRMQIVDVKSGIRASEPTPEHVRQLQLYAALVHAERGEWADDLVIESASGQQHVMELDRTAVLDAVAEVGAAIDQFNELAATESFEAAATPDPDHCRFCTYRVLCRPYWSALTTEWSHRSVLGEIEATSVNEAQQVISVKVASPVDTAGGSIQISGLPASSVGASAQWFAAADLEPVHGRTDLAARWSSITTSW
jgi:RecB family exonuclease